MTCWRPWRPGTATAATPARRTGLSYQEFNATFSPDYPNGTIILTPEFLDSLRDGELVTLTFHFYSGEKKVMYHVKKSGDSVTGTHVPPIP